MPIDRDVSELEVKWKVELALAFARQLHRIEQVWAAKATHALGPKRPDMGQQEREG